MLSAKQKKCIKLMASGEHTQKEIAKQINITEKTICEWKKNDEFMQELDYLIALSIRSVAAKAFKTQTNLLDSKNDMVRYMAAKDILDRAGFKPDEKLKVEGFSTVVFVDDLGEDDEDD
ncbi:phBC6A51 family helix-turn-helix protein [Tepidibacter hydrothermalis]|uniref:PhBC6A51 family helix-turn-helix protein n=1 Tax=Tepidibacter hydrothermalis TaxID=3036126 RepID=A0ABY8EGR2_9FIRM|nr:phBC6A51 family helix-turn-helix protein [Tepidibacter hydrothermalis]WFD09958.1 phBC6A51 family helix-turn-helix protein [Tepidibacter hydrothermalis]